MVLFININIGQRVEVLLDGCIYRGMVKYKGHVVTKTGEWVGVELDEPVGNTCGMILGRHYFQCRERHGVFVRASKIRFTRSGRRLFNRYRRVWEEEPVDETLFTTDQPPVQNGPYDPVRLSSGDYSRIRQSLDFSLDQVFPVHPTPQSYHQSHAIGNKLPAATMTRPATSMSSFRYYSQPIHTCYSFDDDFIPSPTIPKTHMPYIALRRQVKRGWADSHYVREMSIPTGREKMKLAQWNDVTA